MTKMKKILALCLSIMIIISALPLTVGAAEEEILFRAGYRKGKDNNSQALYDGYPDIPYTVTVNGEDKGDGEKTGIGNIGDDLGSTITLSNKAENVLINYKLTTKNSGIFMVLAEVAYSADGNDAIHLYLNGEEVSVTPVEKGDVKTSGFKELGCISVTADEEFTLSFNNIKTTDDGGSSTGSINLRDVKLILQPDPEFEGASIEEGETVNKSTDVITLDYTGAVKDSALGDATVTLKDSQGNVLGVTLAVNVGDNTKADIILNESLQYEESYTLEFSNITLSSGYKFTDTQTIHFNVPAKADDESAETDTLVIDSLELQDTTFTLKGTVTGSKGQAIKGREVNVSFVFPVSGETKEFAKTTDENGKFEVIYTLEGTEVDDSGKYEFTAESEFAVPASDSKRYISQSEREGLLGALETCTNDTEVAGFFEDNDGENADILGVDLTTLNKFGGDKNLFYKRLADATYNDEGSYDLEIFVKVWEDAYALEDINLSDDDAVTLGYLNDADFQNAIALETEKYALLNTQKDAFITAVTALERAESMEAFGKAVNALFNDFIKTELAKTDLALELNDATVYVGQSAYIEVELTAKTSDVKSYTLKVKCPTEEAAEIVGFETENGKVSKTVDSNVVTFAVTDIEGELETLGKLTYSSSSEASYAISVDGAVVYEVSGVEINCEVAKAEADITVKKNSGKSQSSSSSSFTSGGSTVTPVVKPVDKDETIITIGGGFTDIASVEWAYDSIDYLYKKGIISEAADGKFRPNDSVTRAEFVKMLVSALRITDKSAAVKLSDVSQSDWYYEYVSAAVSYGLVLGDEKGNFRPNDRITRQDICVIISRAMDKLGYGKADAGQLFYDDAQISSYAKDAVYRMRTHGIVNGTGDGGFAPLSDATRAATAKIIYAFIKEAKI